MAPADCTHEALHHFLRQ